MTKLPSGLARILTVRIGLGGEDGHAERVGSAPSSRSTVSRQSSVMTAPKASAEILGSEAPEIRFRCIQKRPNGDLMIRPNVQTEVGPLVR